MSVLVWDQLGERFYETGVDKGVLYLPDAGGAYVDGVAWNGLTSVSESPTGAEPNAKYADNLKYLNLISLEEFGATIEAFTYPDEFAQFDGLAIPSAGLTLGQQNRSGFGLSYRTKLGNDILGDDYGYKLHLIYGCIASPSEKAYNTINDSPDAIAFSWDVSTTAVPVVGYKPTSVITLDSTAVDGTILTALELILYGDTGVDPALPTPDAVVTMFGSGITIVTPGVPAFNATDTITIPTVTGVEYYVLGALVPAGALVIAVDTVVTARPAAGYVFTQGVDDDWMYIYA
jgi:hypothetical protein